MDERWARVGKKVGIEMLKMSIAFFSGMLFGVVALFKLIFVMFHKHSVEKSDGPHTPLKFPSIFDK